MSTEPVTIPLASLSSQLDNDDPEYLIGQPGVYLTLALAYDSLAAPAHVVDEQGVGAPDFAAMQPRLATGWERDGDTWRVSLRPGVQSHAGHELTAHDIAWAFEKNYANPAMAAWRWQDTAAVAGASDVRAESDAVVSYRTASTNPNFPAYLQFLTPNIVDSTQIRANATEADPWGIEWLNAHVAGYGAYDLVRLDAREALFTARPDYWQGEREQQHVRLSVVDDRAQALGMLKDSAPVVLLGLDSDEATTMLGLDDVTIEQTWAGHVRVQLNLDEAPFDDERVRRALAFATPYDAIIEIGFRGQARSWRSPLKRISPWYNAEGWPFDTDEATARLLLAEAGWADGFATQLFIPRRPDCERVAALLVAAWSRIGVEMAVEYEPAGLAQSGRTVPMLLSTDCGHNLSEPLYDLVHDFAPFMPFLPEGAANKHGVGRWFLYFIEQPEVVEHLRAALLERDEQRLHARVDELQRRIVDAAGTLHLAEVRQTLAAKGVSKSFFAPDSRFFHAVQYQNARSDCYLPAWG